jgi:DNA-binding beta-propeller fold protein YncE
LAAFLLGGVGAAEAAATTGELTQKPGTAGCLSETGFVLCAVGVALDSAASVTVSPDGRSAYVASANSDAVAVFDRAADGTLTQTGCISETGAGPCVKGRALDGALSVAVSPDGKSAYVASFLSDAVAVLDRDVADGTLTQRGEGAGCISDTGDFPCVDGKALAGASSVTVSPDGSSVYVASFFSDAVAMFDRAVDGRLTQKKPDTGGSDTAGCISETGAGPCVDGKALDGAQSVTVSPDGASAYVASDLSDAVAVFDRAADGKLRHKSGPAGCISETGAGCVDGRALLGAQSVTVSPDGASAYVASPNSGAVAVLDRATDGELTGELTQKPGTAGCISDPSTGAGCADGKALTGALSVTVSPDGASAYVASSFSDAVAVFDRAADGRLAQKPDTAGCIADTGGACGDGTALVGAQSVAVSPDGASAYVATSVSDAVAVFDREPLASPLPTPAPTPPPEPAPSPAPADTTKPLLSALSLSPSRFRAAASGASIVRRRLRRRVGSRVSYTLSEPAAVRFRVERALAGRRVRGRCVRPTRSNRRARRCTRFRTLRGGFTHLGATGPNNFRFTGRLRGRRLRLGRYRLRAVATDPAGNRSRPQRSRFRIVRR